MATVLADVAREMVARTRREQGLPASIENPAALDRLAALLDVGPTDGPATAHKPGSVRDHDTNELSA